MKLPLVFAGLCLPACGHHSEEQYSAGQIKQYAFYTWTSRSGELCFTFMTEEESHRFIHRWFPRTEAKCGIPELKKELTGLPKSAYIYWRDWPPKFNYPPDRVIDEMNQFARDNGIHLELMPTLR